MIKSSAIFAKEEMFHSRRWKLLMEDFNEKFSFLIQCQYNMAINWQWLFSFIISQWRTLWLSPYFLSSPSPRLPSLCISFIYHSLLAVYSFSLFFLFHSFIYSFFFFLSTISFATFFVSSFFLFHLILLLLLLFL